MIVQETVHKEVKKIIPPVDKNKRKHSATSNDDPHSPVNDQTNPVSAPVNRSRSKRRRTRNQTVNGNMNGNSGGSDVSLSGNNNGHIIARHDDSRRQPNRGHGTVVDDIYHPNPTGNANRGQNQRDGTTGRRRQMRNNGNNGINPVEFTGHGNHGSIGNTTGHADRRSNGNTTSVNHDGQRDSSGIGHGNGNHGNSNRNQKGLANGIRNRNDHSTVGRRSRTFYQSRGDDSGHSDGQRNPTVHFDTNNGRSSKNIERRQHRPLR